MSERTRILLVSANPWTTTRILVDEEAREIFEKLQQGPYRDKFELQKHAAVRAVDLQRLLMMYKPHIVHFSVHGSKKQKLILGSTSGRGRELDRSGLVDLFALYRKHVRLVFLNACFTRIQAQSLCQVIDYAVGTGKMIGDKGGVAFAAAFYRALSFGKSVSEAFQSAKAELALTRIPRSKGLELFMREGLRRDDSFPKTRTRGKHWRPEGQTKRRTSSDVGCIHGRCGGFLQHPTFSPSSSLVGALLPTGVRDASPRQGRRFERQGSVRAEAIVTHRCSSAFLQTRPGPALKTIRKPDEARRGSGRRRGKEPSSISLLPPPSTTVTVRVLRVMRTESFDLVVSNLKKDE